MKDLCIVTATTNPEKAFDCIKSWGDVPLVVVYNGQHRDAPMPLPHIENRDVMAVGGTSYLGTVPAFNLGVQEALKFDYQIIACFHDDLELLDPEWAKKVVTHFKRHPECGLAGFGGAIGLGDSDIYEKEYQPQQLARIGFRSNMTNAEIHGIRSLLPERVACLDSFSMIFRAELAGRTWQTMEDLGLVHHFHDGAAACIAARATQHVWYLPIACTHYGGRTAVGDAGYNEWAKAQNGEGDQGYWKSAHEISYREFKDVLPIRV